MWKWVGEKTEEPVKIDRKSMAKFEKLRAHRKQQKLTKTLLEKISEDFSTLPEQICFNKPPPIASF